MKVSTKIVLGMVATAAASQLVFDQINIRNLRKSEEAKIVQLEIFRDMAIYATAFLTDEDQAEMTRYFQDQMDFTDIVTAENAKYMTKPEG